jgi:glutamyl-tRNA synthetase
MLLRIEDTDRERSTEAAVKAIFDGLKWLGLDWDGEPFRSSPARSAIARWRNCWRPRQGLLLLRTPQELEAMREKAEAEGRPPRYDGRWRDRDPSEAPAGRQAGHPHQGAAGRRDRRRRPRAGPVVIPNKDLDDLIILRSDGNPTYMLAVVVDDHDMGVTHIIRGDDHLTNAARQTQIYNGMGWACRSWRTSR